MKLDPLTHHGYNIATALRGPDNEHSRAADSAKSLTTAVLRYLIGIPEDNDVGCYVYSTAAARRTWEALGRARQADVVSFLAGEGHFCFHFQYALQALTSRHLNRKTWREAREYRDWLFSVIPQARF